MIGKQLSPILLEIEAAIIEFDCEKNAKPCYTKDAIRAAGKIFISVMMDKMWELQEFEKIPIEQRMEMASKCGNDIRNIIKTYCNIDSHDFYKQTIVGKDYIISSTIKYFYHTN